MAKRKGNRKVSVQAELRKNVKTFWKIFGGIMGIIFLTFILASWGVFGSLPDETSLENPEKNLATEIIASDGKVIGKFYKENRTPIQYEELPEHLINALIATEDVRFYDHSGIDARGTVRAFVLLGSRGGASTISQQLAKLFFTEKVSRSKLQRGMQKIKEWIISIRLERRYTKEEIITMYFNEYDFLNQAVSQMAKYNFISETVKDSLQALPLEIRYTPQGHDEGLATYFREYARAYMLDWIKENPKSDGSTYNIYSDGLKVYTTIDSKMQEYAEQAMDMHISSLQKEFDSQNKKNKITPFRDVTEEEIDGIMNSAMKRSDRWREMEKQGKSKEEIIKSFSKKTSMRIFAWSGDIDTIMTPLDSIRYYKSILQASLMSMTPQTGEVRAWVGGINYKHFKYDMVKKGRRQIGSTFKPFVYATVIDQMHMSPCDTMPNTQYTIPQGKYGIPEAWTPKNSGDKYGGMVTLKHALANSINTVTARLIDRVGPRPVIELVKKMGVETKDMPEAPSIALGTPDVSLYEMVGAYSTFVNEGVYVKPILISRIEDKNGTVLFQNIPETKDVISSETAYVTVSLMEGVVESGSGSRLRGTWRTGHLYENIITGYPYDFKNPIAGKTGTTQNNSDGWFIGMVPNLVTGVWVGGEDRSTHFADIVYGQGATMALPVWAIYMKKNYEDEDLSISNEAFTVPEDVSIITDCEEFKQINSGSHEIPDELEF